MLDYCAIYVYRDLRIPLFPTNSYKTASISINPRLTDKQAAKGCQVQGKSNPLRILNSQHLSSMVRSSLSDSESSVHKDSKNQLTWTPAHFSSPPLWLEYVLILSVH